MTYFLDFDRTMFDTDAFIAAMRSRLSGRDAGALPDMLRAGTLSFRPGELSPFLYADAAQFLREKENAVTVVTYGDRLLQEAKAKSAFFGIPRVSVMYTEGVRKGSFLAPHVHLHKGAVLADDSPVELEILANACPEIRLFEVRRDGEAGDGRWPVIRTLAELP